MFVKTETFLRLQLLEDKCFFWSRASADEENLIRIKYLLRISSVLHFGQKDEILNYAFFFIKINQYILHFFCAVTVVSAFAFSVEMFSFCNCQFSCSFIVFVSYVVMSTCCIFVLIFSLCICVYKYIFQYLFLQSEFAIFTYICT